MVASCRGSHIVIPNTEACTAAGILSAGAICAETLTNKARDLTFDEYLDFLEPQVKRPDPAHPGEFLPARGGAICQSVDDWNAQKTALELACRVLGKNCTYQMHQILDSMEWIERQSHESIQ